jgi:hypothetical protein
LQYGLSDVSTSIIPQDSYQSDRIGYYLLETVANFEIDYRTGDERKGTITSIMSKQYNSSDFITVYSQSSIPYEHVGEPLVLSSMTTRIIDPSTGQPVSTLGKASVIFMEIIRSNVPTKTVPKSIEHGHKGDDRTDK